MMVGRRLVLVVGLLLVSVVLSTSAGLAQAVGVIPGSAPPGTEITVFGDGFAPGEEITVFFGGIEVVTFADDTGSFTVSLTIDELMPPGMHPLDVDGDQGNSFNFEYLVEEPPPPTTTTTQPATTTTQPATTTTAAPTTTEGATTTAAPPTTAAGTSVPSTIVDDTQVSISSGGGVPWWLFFLAILFAIALGAGVMMAINNLSAMKAGEFTDDKGNTWKICSVRTCKVKRGKQLNNKNVVKAVPRGEKCQSDCKCVLFSWPVGKDATPSLEDEDGDWVLKSGTKRYKARCVKKI